MKTGLQLLGLGFLDISVCSMFLHRVAPFFFLFMGVFTALSAQNRFAINGYVKEAETGEAVIGASIVAIDSKTGALTNEYGFYSLRLPEGKHRIAVYYAGFKPDTVAIELKANVEKNFEIRPEVVELETVEVKGEAEDANVSSTGMSSVKMDMKAVKTMPALFGEVDVLRTIQLMPGVKSAGEGNNSFFVRGGNYDQNLILLDEAPVYNASHLMGFFSVFNSDAIKDVTLYKGGIPAQYGGRLSSVLNIRMNEGNMKKYSVKGGVGVLSARLNAEGPLPWLKDKASFIVSFRRTYADQFLRFAKDPAIRKNKLYFYDGNAKLNFIIGQKDRVFVSGYFGKDVLNLGGDFGMEWGNVTASARWNHLFSSRLFSNTTAYYSQFDYGFFFNDSKSAFRYSSGVKDVSLKNDFDYYLNPNNKIRFGAQITYQMFRSGEVSGDDSSFVTATQLPLRKSFLWAVYIGNEQKIGKRISLEYGIRYSFFHQIGAGTVYYFDKNNGGFNTLPRDSAVYGSGQLIKTYHGPEPRLSAKYQFNEKNSVKLSYNRTQQFLHVASNSGAGLPTDLWLPSTAIIPPQRCDQIAAGYFRNFKQNMFETSVEIYYKQLYNQVDFRPNARLITNPYQDNEFLFGKGFAYGAEFLAKKSKGRFTGWVGYTLSWSQRKFDDIDSGRVFMARNDRRHDVSIVLSYELGKRWVFAATWIYSTGLPISLPRGKYSLDGQVVGLYTGRNEYRMPDSHRMDLSVTYKTLETKKFRQNINLSVYNAYARKNPFSIQLRTSEDGTRQEAVMIYLFSIVPSLTYNFEF